MSEKPVSWDAVYVLIIMTLVYSMSVADRFIGSILIEPIKQEFALSDSAVGLLTGVGVALFYCTAAFPLGALADRVNRRNMIAWSLLVWSAITVLCGLTRTFWQLLIARFGVGIGEAGGTPAQQSLMADIFPPHTRGMAMTIFALGSSIGSMIGSIAGGWLSDRYGWRSALIALGVLGLPLVPLLRFTVTEPVRGKLDAQRYTGSAALLPTLRFCWAQRSLRHVIIGATVITYWGWGLIWWTPAFLTRSHHLSVGEAGALLGPMQGIGGTVVMIAAAALMGLLGKRDSKTQVWLVFATTIIGTVPSIIVYATSSLALATAMLWLFVPLTYLFIGPSLALVQNLTPAPMRARVVAVYLFTANVANLILASQIIGLISDWLRHTLAHPQESLRWALLATSFLGIWGAVHFALSARYLEEDLIRAGSKSREAAVS